MDIIVVEEATGQRYVATMLMLTKEEGEPAVSFLCSETMLTFKVADIRSIECTKPETEKPAA